MRLPSLRERRQDIPLLARHFLQKSARELNVETKRLTDAATRFLESLDWRGNVRQLENICHWLTVMAPGVSVDMADLPAELKGETPLSTAIDWRSALELEVAHALTRGERGILDRLSQDFERALITQALIHTGGRRIEAAQLLGWGRNTLTRKIQELGLDEAENSAKMGA